MPVTQEAPLKQLARRLHQALMSTAAGREPTWLENAQHALGEFLRTFHEHAAAADRPDGQFSEIAKPCHQTELTLARRVTELRDDHIHILDLAGHLQKRLQHFATALEHREPQDEVAALQADGDLLVNTLRRHLRKENKLFLDAMNTDVGVGD